MFSAVPIYICVYHSYQTLQGWLYLPYNGDLPLIPARSPEKNAVKLSAYFLLDLNAEDLLVLATS